jgi:hypothetical protein
MLAKMGLAAAAIFPQKSTSLMVSVATGGIALSKITAAGRFGEYLAENRLNGSINLFHAGTIVPCSLFPVPCSQLHSFPFSLFLFHFFPFPNHFQTTFFAFQTCLFAAQNLINSPNYLLLIIW